MRLPAVSVIIPLYNVESYVGECLDSLLAQTFQDFEVIVVDDCSTDNSVAVVENYAPKFGGRLKLFHMAKNSGGAGLPRNKGIKFARGEYIYCLDPDDIINPTAFEKMYSVAKDFNADVVQCEKWFYIPENLWNDIEYRKNPSILTHPAGEKIFTTKPTLLTDNLEVRINDYIKWWLTWSVCLQMIRRDFILENDLEFCDCHCEDMIFSLCEMACAKNYVVIPDIFYNYRTERKGSAVNEMRTYSKIFHKTIHAIKSALKYFDNFFRNHDELSTRPQLKYMLMDMFMQEVLPYTNPIYNDFPIHELDRLLQKEFSDVDNVSITAFIFNMMNGYRLSLEKNLRQTAELEKINRQNQAYISELEKFVAQLLPKE